MKFEFDEFPILKLLAKEPGYQEAFINSELEKARKGGDEDKYHLALTLHTFVKGSGCEPAGTTPEIYEYTRR